jgi:hypothetical protein
MKKSLLLGVVFTTLTLFIPIRSQIQPHTVETVLYATTGVVFAVSAVIWASHAKCAWNIDTRRDNRINKMIHKFVLLSSAFASVALASASCTSFKISYDLWQSNH